MRNIRIFSLIALGCGWIGRLIDLKAGMDAGGSLGQLLWIVCPLLCMVVLRAFGGDGWRDLGIRPQVREQALFYAISLLFSPCCALLMMWIVQANGLGTVTFSAPVLAAIGTALLPSLLKNLFEEFAWRGYLAPKVYGRGWPTWLAHAYVGLIWAAWHLPYLYLFVDPTADWFYPRFLLGIAALSVVYGEIRLLTGSVWPAVVMHAAGNAVIDTLILRKYFVISKEYEYILMPSPDGLLAIVFAALTGCWLYVIRMRRSASSSAG
ncbi:CPBP family intramembrane glutamic endopeptidase [Bacillus sp. 3255]|uniref:CPBP family intramembrane glutamic endopeptidase n=1 Tax=Bacillus sp. 3255 TaxID=2817904 RepID=UPI0028542175|nr:CPBP family intramembrane glutamic endopeptidase [Bacillus sp. 3255]MDR6882009.1 membrane protease YdiL (CAAX protease family) [Bacillus sp. 3255]